MIDAHDYTITVRRRKVGDETVFEAYVAELPDVRSYGDSYQEAYEAAVEAISSLEEDASAEGVEFPQPLPVVDNDYSGRVTLRLPKHIHRMAAEIAAVQGVSFNAYLSSVITSDVARTQATTSIVAQYQPLLEQIRGLLERTAQTVATSTRDISIHREMVISLDTTTPTSGAFIWSQGRATTSGYPEYSKYAGEAEMPKTVRGPLMPIHHASRRRP